MTTNDPRNLDNLEARFLSAVSVTNDSVAARDRDVVKTGALLSIARSLEAKRIPDTWEPLEAPNGVRLGWFDPTVAAVIGQALGASGLDVTDDSEPDAEPDDLPVEVGAAVVLTSALENALNL